MKGFAIVTACSKRYMDKLRLTLPTWTMKPRFKGAPLYILTDDGLNEDWSFARKHFPKVSLLRGVIRDGETQREAIFRSLFQSTVEIPESHWVKFDADTFFIDDRDIFTEDDFDCDIVSGAWGYTKPGTWLKDLDKWADRLQLPGKPYLVPGQEPNPGKHGHRRIISWICLHKTEFTRYIAGLIGERMPVPSHDTLAWYLAERIPGRLWSTHRFRAMGVRTFTHIGMIQKVLDELKK